MAKYKIIHDSLYFYVRKRFLFIFWLAVNGYDSTKPNYLTFSRIVFNTRDDAQKFIDGQKR